MSGNKLESLRDLEVLQGLTQLYASDNLLNDIKELSQLLPFWTKLWRLELVGNPLCHKSKYKDKIIIMGKNLGVFKYEISVTNHLFINFLQYFNLNFLI